jgi:hypothetical protein
VRFQVGFRRFFFDGFPLDAKNLTDVGKVQVVLQSRTALDAPCLDAAMIGQGGFGEIQRAAGFEQQGDIAFQLRLVAFDREVIVRPLLDCGNGMKAMSD